VKKVCVELWNVLQPLYLATPTKKYGKIQKLDLESFGIFPTA